VLLLLLYHKRESGTVEKQLPLFFCFIDNTPVKAGKSKGVTKKEIADAIHEQTGLPKDEAAMCVEGILDMMKGTLAHVESVKVAGFGTFNVRKKSVRKGRNPKTGDEIEINLEMPWERHHGDCRRSGRGIYTPNPLKLCYSSSWKPKP
jgi:integration host factor subunit alpha